MTKREDEGITASTLVVIYGWWRGAFGWSGRVEEIGLKGNSVEG